MTQAFGSISEDLSENFLTFDIHSTKCLPHHSTKEKVLALEAGIVLTMLLASGETACSMLVSFWQYLLTRVPCTQSKVVRRRAKLRRQRNQPETTDLEIPFFSASVAASRLTTR